MLFLPLKKKSQFRAHPCSECKRRKMPFHIIHDVIIPLLPEIPLPLQEGQADTKGLILRRVKDKTMTILIDRQIFFHRRFLYGMNEANGKRRTR